MQAIITKFIPATNYRPSRYKATCRLGSVTISANHGAGLDENHLDACTALCLRFAMQDKEKYGTNVIDSAWTRKRVVGQLPDGSYAHVFVEPK